MASACASTLPATSNPDAYLSKGAHTGTSKGGIAFTVDTGPPDFILPIMESTAQASSLYTSLTYSCPDAIPSYSPTTGLHWRPSRVGFEPRLPSLLPPPSLPAREPIAYRTRSLAPTPSPLALFTAGRPLHESLTRCPRPNQFGPLLRQLALQVSAVPCRPQSCGICRSLPIIVPVRHARGAFSS